MALPAVIPTAINVWRGDSLSIPVRVWSDAAKTHPVDLTGFGTVFTAQACPSSDTNADIPLTVDATGAATGQLILSLTPAQTATLAQATYRFDVQAASADGSSVTTLVTGKLLAGGDFNHA